MASMKTQSITQLATTYAKHLSAKPGGPKPFWYCRTPAGWRYLPIKEKNKYPQGKPFIRTMVDGKRVYKPVEGDINAALMVAAVFKTPTKRTPATIEDDIKRYRDSLIEDDYHDAEEHARLVLPDFVTITGVTQVREVTERHLRAYCVALRARKQPKQSPRTIANKYARVRSFLKFSGSAAAMKKPPTYEEPGITTYTPDEISALLAHSDSIDVRSGCPQGYMRVVILMGMQIGLREKEMAYSQWSDINFTNRSFRVQSKPHLGFKVKKEKPRTVGIRADCLQVLKEWKAQRDAQGIQSSFILGIGPDGDRVNGHLLRWLQAVGKHAGLPEKDDMEKGYIGLHKMRRTALTDVLRGTSDLASVQEVAGHKDLKSTQRYLQALSPTEIADKVDAARRNVQS
jgi:integrase